MYIEKYVLSISLLSKKSEYCKDWFHILYISTRKTYWIIFIKTKCSEIDKNYKIMLAVCLVFRSKF